MEFGKTYTLVSFQRLQTALVLRTRAILIVSEKLTRQCMFFPQIALETILLLPIQILNKFWRPITRNCMQQQIL